MNYLHKISIDMNKQEQRKRIGAVQGDQYARQVEISLFDEDTPWTIPSSAGCAIRFRKPDGRGGVYSKMPDGNSAWSIEGNKLTISLAPQVLTVGGLVEISAALLMDASILGIFVFEVQVEYDPSVGASESCDYYDHCTLEEINTAIVSLQESQNRLSAGKASMEELHQLRCFHPLAAAAYNGILSDAWHIDTTGPFQHQNLPRYCIAGSTANIPADFSHGIREVYFLNSNNVWIELSGFDTTGQYARWGNCWNGTSWLGWNKLTQQKYADAAYAPMSAFRFTPAFSAGNAAPSDLLNIDMNGDFDASSNLWAGHISTEDASVLSGSPVNSGPFYAFRTVEKSPVGHFLVTLREMYPVTGRVWTNMYDTNVKGWYGWHSNFSGDKVSQTDLAAALQHRYYSIAGVVLNGGSDLIEGVGGAGAVSIDIAPGGLARIDFTLTIFSSGTDTTAYHYGINRDLFRQINANVPQIVPLAGGHFIAFHSEGTVNEEITGRGGTFLPSEPFWMPARVHNIGDDFLSGIASGWEETQMTVGTRLTGTCYGIALL